MLLSLMTYGMVEITFRDSIREGYTALDARSRYETQALREFLNMLNGGSMHRKAHLDEADRIVDTISNLTIKYKDQKLIYNELCSPYCFTNELFKTFKRYFDVNYRSAVKNHYYSDLYNLSYPFASIWGYRVPIEQCLYGVRLPSSNESTGVSLRVGASKSAFYSLPFFPQTSKRKDQFSLGFALMFSTVVICLFSSSYYHNAIDFGKILVGLAAILCPLLAITSTFGLLTLFASRINSLLLVMPFLIMGIGVDSSFLMIHSWVKMAGQNCDAASRLASVYEESGPSITISSMTNVLSFGIGAITPTPEIRLFCYGTSTAIFLTYIFQLFLFGATLSIATAYERPYLHNEDLNSSNWKSEAHWLACAWVYRAVLILLLTVFYWYYALGGAFTMKIRLNSAKILAKDSYLHKPDFLLNSEHLSPVLLVNNRFDITDINLTTQFWNTLKELESLPLCKGCDAVLLRSQHSRVGCSLVKLLHDLQRATMAMVLSISQRRMSVVVFVFYGFLSTFSGNITVERFLFTVGFRNISNWDVRIALMTQWRDVIAKYPALNMTIYESAGFFVDQMLSLKAVDFQTALLTVVSMTVVCATFMRSMINIVTAAASMASISIGVIGIMSKMGFDLDPVVMVSFLMTIGISVDYIAHIAYHIQNMLSTAGKKTWSVITHSTFIVILKIIIIHYFSHKSSNS
uniref:SSD domain-containing protein n=1 Tax=Angiostrongylus cantonensis TaxID=6313 RepID=A0A158P8B0_ANGCA